MANIVFKCAHLNIGLNEVVTITFSPNTNVAADALQVVECAPETFVLESLDLYSWNNDITLGISNPQKCVIKIKFDRLQKQLAPDLQEYLFNSILQPFQKITIYEGEVNSDGEEEWRYDTYLSNYVKVESATLGVIHFMQDVYSTVDLDRLQTEMEISCIDLLSNVLKYLDCAKTINYVLDHLETLGTFGVDYDYSKFAFDWINMQVEDDMVVTDNGVVAPNKLFKLKTPFGVVISGQNKLDGANVSKNTNVINNYSSWPKDQSGYSFQQFPSRVSVDRKPAGGNVTTANNGLQRLEFLNIERFYNLLLQQANVILNRFDITIEDNFTLDLSIFYKQKYDGSFAVGEKLASNNTWFLYRVRGCGTYTQLSGTDTTGNSLHRWQDTEYYLTNQDITKQLQYSCIYDLLTDILSSSLNAYIINNNSVSLFAEPTDVVAVDLLTAAVQMNIAFNYKVVNIQTGRADLNESPDTTTVIGAPGTAENINIPSFYNSYPISPERAFNHSFVVTTNENDQINYKVQPSVECLYVSNDYEIGEYIADARWQSMYPSLSPYENWGNCGFFYSDTIAIRDSKWDNTPGRYNFKWAYTMHSVRFGLKPNARASRRPVDMMHLNSVNFSPVKVWYREQYGTIAPYTEESTAWPVFPDAFTFIAAHHTGDNTTAASGFSFTDFFWPFMAATGEDARVSDRNTDYAYSQTHGYLGTYDTTQLAILYNNVLTQTNSFNKVKEKYVQYCQRAKATFDNNWYKTLHDKLAKSYVSRIVELKVKPAQIASVFNNIALTDLRNHLFDIKLTDDPIKKILNTKYKVISISLSNGDCTIKLSADVG